MGKEEMIREKEIDEFMQNEGIFTNEVICPICDCLTHSACPNCMMLRMNEYLEKLISLEDVYDTINLKNGTFIESAKDLFEELDEEELNNFFKRVIEMFCLDLKNTLKKNQKDWIKRAKENHRS